MTSLTAPDVVTSSTRTTVGQLARIEAVRYARHPLFLVGFLLAGVFSAGEFGPVELDYHVIPSFFIGVLGIIVAARLTASTDRAQPVLGAAPVSETARTAAMCLACLVPAVAGAAVVLMHRAFVLAEPFPDFMYDTYGSTDRFVITVVVPVIACAGGPLLGVAAARWLRFPGAALVTVLVTLFWSNIAAYVPSGSSMDPSTLFARVLHMATPYTAFVLGNGDGEHPTTVLTSTTGSPTWWAVWTAALCGLAVTAALWRSAEGRTRSLVGRWFAALLVVALVSLTLSVATGNDRLWESTSRGTTPALNLP